MPASTDYDAIAARYAAGIDSRPWNALYERPTTLALLPDVGGKDVLDAGCGPGWYADRLARAGARVVAVDCSAAMARHAAARLGDRARVLQGDIGDLAMLDAASFDMIVSSLVLHYVADVAPTFREWARLLRPGGRLVFSTHHPVAEGSSPLAYSATELVDERWGWLDVTMRYYRRPLGALTEPLAAAGFLIERIVEPKPSEELRKRDPAGHDRLSRLPAFIFFRALKPPS